MLLSRNLGMLSIAAIFGFSTTLADFWRLIGETGFPNQIFNDSWVVGFWRADHGGHEVEVGRRAWTLAQAIPGSFRSQGAAADVSALYLGIDWTGRSQERPADGGAAGTGRL